MTTDQRKFEIVSKYKNANLHLPARATQFSAGYDIEAAEDVNIPSIWTPSLIYYFKEYYKKPSINDDQLHALQDYVESTIKPTLVPTGIKVKMPRDNCLMLFNRSSNPLKRNLILANGTGIIDSDYYNNKTNEGEIFGSFYNASPKPYLIHKGDRIMQGIFQPYLLTSDDHSDNQRTGGFGSTNA